MDWAEASRILGVSEAAGESEVKEQYLYKAQLLHPDKNQDKPENVRKRAEGELALVNQAYAFLSNCENNPYRRPPKLAVEPAKIRFKLNLGEKKTTTLLIKNIGGPYTSIWIDSNPAPWLTVTAANSISTERLPLEVTLEGTGTGEPDKCYTSNLGIRLENEITRAVDNACVEVELLTAAAPDVPVVKPAPPVGTLSQAKIQGKPASGQKRSVGFSLSAFLVNFLAFAVLGAGAVYSIKTFLSVDDSLILAGCVLYGLLAFGISFNHAFTVGSRARNSRLDPQNTRSRARH
jgi:hypothetical protein